MLNCAFALRALPRIGDDLFELWIQGFARRNMDLLLVGIAALLMCVWKLYNASCFERKTIRPSIEMISDVSQTSQFQAILETSEANKMVLSS